MARGRFGHRPRATGNLTALVAQLYREQQAANDRVMFDAYQNGGKGLDGKPVTDQTMRAYIAGRRNGFTKDDPLYSEWNNRLIQLDFKIGEEKVQLSYRQGHVGAGAVAAFYRRQLNDIPHDSEFYRTVAGRAADWAKAAAGAARGAARARLSKAMEAKQNAVQATWDRYGQLVGYLTEAAKRAGLIAGTQTLTDADATDLQAFLRAGVAGPGGKPITFADWQSATVTAYRGFDTLIAVNKQLGRGTKDLVKDKQKFLDQNLVRVNTIDDRAKYELARDAFEQANKDAGADPSAYLEAVAAYSKTLSEIKASAERGGGATGNDPEFVGGLQNEINALAGKVTGPTVYDLQSTSGEGVKTSDAESTAATIVGDGQQIIGAQNEVKMLATGKAYLGQEAFGGPLEVVPLKPGAGLSGLGPFDGDKSMQQSFTNIDGKVMPVVLKGQPVTTVGLLDPKGHPVTTVGGVPVDNLSSAQVGTLLSQGYSMTKDAATVGYVFSDPQGKVSYGVIQANGSLAYTTVNPFGSSFATKDGLQIVGAAVQAANGSAVPKLPQINVSNAESVLTDPGVTPKDLLALATDPKNAAIAPELQALAQKREAEVTAERNYENRVQAPKGPGIVGSITNLVGDALRDVSLAVKNAGAPVYDQPSVPKLPALTPAPSIVPVGQPGNALIPGPQQNPSANFAPTPEVPIPVGQPGNALIPGHNDPNDAVFTEPKAPTQGGSGGKYAL